MCVRLLICGMEMASGCWVVRAGMHASASWGLRIVTWPGTLEVHDWVHWRFIDTETLTPSGSVGRIALVDLWQETLDTLNEAATPLRAGRTQMTGLWLCTFHRLQKTPELWSGQTAFTCKTVVGVCFFNMMGRTIQLQGCAAGLISLHRNSELCHKVFVQEDNAEVNKQTKKGENKKTSQPK